MRPHPALLIAPFALTLAVEAFAEPSARLIYSRTPEAASCPGEPALRKAVAARVGYDPFFPWAKQTVVVRIGLQHGTFAARVEIIDEDGVARGARELSSTESDCVEIFDATALAMSIALDASAPVEPPRVETATPAPAATPAPPTPPPMEPAAPPAAAPPDTGVSPPRTSERVLFAGADVLGSWGTAPSIAAGGTIFFGARAGFVSAALELHADLPASTTITGGVVTSWLYAASVVPCAHYRIASLCAVGEVGSLQGSGQALESLPKSTLFAAAGGRLGGEWPLMRTVSLRAHVDVLRNLAPSALRIDANTWPFPPVAVSAGIGFLVRFP